MTGISEPSSPGSWSAGTDGEPYDQVLVVGAVLLAFFLPLISLIIALVMRSTEPNQQRRRFLKNWAVGSAAWMFTGWLIAVIAFASVASGPSGCTGGIDQTVPPSFTSNDNVHWTETYTCLNGGTGSRPAPPGSVPGQ